MNLRQFSIAVLVSALPAVSLAHTDRPFDRGDFVAFEKVSEMGEMVVRLKLSKSGKAKLKKLNRPVYHS